MDSIRIILEDENLIKKYIESLTPFEIKALSIAENQLESSFILEKSIGFLKYKSENKSSENHQT
tara:strand:+ start:889 stop:1080 length:192 start_codon:yes stop_codon:yes gene_type:complete